jgi:predicted DNA-binding protein
MWRIPMAKKVIQVPIDDNLLFKLDNLSRKQSKARSEIIRRACQYYIKKMESEELDRIYQQGYERLPEGIEIGEAQVTLLSEIIPREEW